MPLDLPCNGDPRLTSPIRRRSDLLRLNVRRLVNSKFRDVVKVGVACSQIVNPKLFHSSDDQGVVGKEPVPRPKSLGSVKPSFVRRQHEDVQTKDGQCLRPVFYQLSDFPPFAS